jgi:hypothetical protein
MNKILDYFDVPVLHCVAIAITFTDIETALKFVSLLLAIGYTIWKWISEYKHQNNLRCLLRT